MGRVVMESGLHGGHVSGRGPKGGARGTGGPGTAAAQGAGCMKSCSQPVTTGWTWGTSHCLCLQAARVEGPLRRQTSTSRPSHPVASLVLATGACSKQHKPAHEPPASGPSRLWGTSAMPLSAPTRPCQDRLTLQATPEQRRALAGGRAAALGVPMRPAQSGPAARGGDSSAGWPSSEPGGQAPDTHSDQRACPGSPRVLQLPRGGRETGRRAAAPLPAE